MRGWSNQIEGAWPDLKETWWTLSISVSDREAVAQLNSVVEVGSGDCVTLNASLEMQLQW